MVEKSPPAEPVPTQFARLILANVRYWQQQVDSSDDPAVLHLLPERDNLYRAAEFGLAVEDAWPAAARLILSLHYFIEHHGQWRRWQVLLQRAIACCTPPADDELCLQLLSHAGQYFRQDRDWEASFAAHVQEERMAAAEGNAAAVARAHQNLASLYWRQRRYEEAGDYAAKALAGFLALGADDRTLGGAYTAAGLVYFGKGDYPEAIAAHQAAVDHFRRTKFTVFLARSLVNLALAQEGDGQREHALASYSEARSILAPTSYELDKSRVAISLGTLLYNWGRLAQAEEAFLQAYSPYLQRAGPPYFLGLATNNLGNLYLQQGRLGEAEAMLRQSLDFWKQAQAGLQHANSIGTLAGVRAAQGRCEEARVLYEEAIAVAEQYAADGWARQILSEFQAGLKALADGEG